MINTIDINQHSTRLDGYEIRRAAVENNVTIFTSLETSVGMNHKDASVYNEKVLNIFTLGSLTLGNSS